jgi:two-component system response regulator AtoC
LNQVREKVLIIDDDPAIRWSLREILQGWQYQPLEAASIEEARRLFALEQPAAILLDIELPDGSGLDILREVKDRQFDTIVIIVTGNVNVPNVVAALRGGAYDFIGKPINLEELRVTLQNCFEVRRLRREMGRVRRERARAFGFDRIIGRSRAMQETLALARKVASAEATSVLLQGESGTGKDLLAKAIHYGSNRAEGPFVAINCAALPENLIEAELFGHEKGAFTDAKQRKEGLIEQASGGTLFLDEIGELDLSLQAKLLRVLEEGRVRRIGALREVEIDVRVIAASNRDLRAETEAGRFRLDLYYRLAVIRIDLPPLRERGDDLFLLADYYIDAFNRTMRRSVRVRGLTEEAKEAFKRYGWPGNVRELRNVIERAMILEDGEWITCEHLPLELRHGSPTGAFSEEIVRLPPSGLSLDEVERSLVRQAIRLSGGNQTRAAELLGISRDQLRYRLKKLREIDEAASHRSRISEART